MLYLRQLLWLGFSLAFGAVIAMVPYRVYQGRTAWLLYGFGLFLLVLTLFVGHTGLGAQRWLGWGPAKIQPSEPAKVAMVILLANLLADRKQDLTELRSLAKPLLVVAVPFLLVLRQPDLGTSVAFIAILLTMLFWSGLPLLYLFFLVSPLLNVALSFFLPGWILFARPWCSSCTAPACGSRRSCSSWA